MRKLKALVACAMLVTSVAATAQSGPISNLDGSGMTIVYRSDGETPFGIIFADRSVCQRFNTWTDAKAFDGDTFMGWELESADRDCQPGSGGDTQWYLRFSSAEYMGY